MIIDCSKAYLQKDFAALIGVSEKTVSELISRGVIDKGQSIGEWNRRYCVHIREQAAGRATDGDLNLATERAFLAREQKIRIELQNAISRREYAPIEALENGLSDVMARVAAQLDTIPAKLKMASDKLTATDLDLVSSIIAKVRNEIAASEIDWFGDSTTEGNDYQDVQLDS